MDFLTTDSVQLLFGLFYFLVGLSLIIKPGPWKSLYDKMAKSDVSLVITGIFTLIIGLIITIFYWDFGTVGHKIISLIGVFSLIKAGLFLYAPHVAKKHLLGHSLTKMSGGISVVLGGLLLLL